MRYGGGTELDDEVRVRNRNLLLPLPLPLPLTLTLTLTLTLALALALARTLTLTLTLIPTLGAWRVRPATSIDELQINPKNLNRVVNPLGSYLGSLSRIYTNRLTTYMYGDSL